MGWPVVQKMLMVEMATKANTGQEYNKEKAHVTTGQSIPGMSGIAR